MRLDINEELYLSSFHHGVKLLTPETIQNSKMKFDLPETKGVRVADLLMLPVNVYFLNAESELQVCNEQNVRTCGYNSFKEALGTTIQIVAKDRSGDQIVYNDKQTMRENTLQIIEESHTKIMDGFDACGLSFKVPIYNSDNKIQGVFGMTARLEPDAAVKLDKALACIIATGLFPLGGNIDNVQAKTNKHKRLPGMKFKDIYFSSQESRCLHQLIRGKSIKSIARHLELSPRTVEGYLNNMRFKAKVNYNSELIEMVVNVQAAGAAFSKKEALSRSADKTF